MKPRVVRAQDIVADAVRGGCDSAGAASAEAVAQCVAACSESFELSCYSPGPLRAALATDLALLRVAMGSIVGLSLIHISEPTRPY